MSSKAHLRAYPWTYGYYFSIYYFYKVYSTDLLVLFEIHLRFFRVGSKERILQPVQISATVLEGGLRVGKHFLGTLTQSVRKAQIQLEEGRDSRLVVADRGRVSCASRAADRDADGRRHVHVYGGAGKDARVGGQEGKDHERAELKVSGGLNHQGGRGQRLAKRNRERRVGLDGAKVVVAPVDIGVNFVDRQRGQQRVQYIDSERDLVSGRGLLKIIGEEIDSRLKFEEGRLT